MRLVHPHRPWRGLRGERRASAGWPSGALDVLFTADCGITCVNRGVEARAAGLEVIVTDHHHRRRRSPTARSCTRSLEQLSVHRALRNGGRLQACLRPARRVRGRGREADEPTSTSSRLRPSPTSCPWSARTARWCGRGLARRPPRGTRPGLRALIEASGADAERLDEGDLGFRLAPRINAAGRLYRADAGVELFLTEDPGRAAEIAVELDRTNRERRSTEREVETAAEAPGASCRRAPGGAGAGCSRARAGIRVWLGSSPHALSSVTGAR